MPSFATLSTYGISYAGLWGAVLADIVPDDLKFPLIFGWSIAGLGLALVGAFRGKK